MMRYSFFGYALAVAIILVICSLSYQIFFSSKVRPSVNRGVLLSILFLGLMTPLAAVLFITGYPNQGESLVIGQPIVANVFIEKPSNNTFSSAIVSLLPYLNYIYISGIIVMVITTIVSLIRLLIIKAHSEKTILHGIPVYKHNNKLLSSFSWMNWIFVYDGATEKDIYALLYHEKAHVTLYHWVDIIIIQLILIFQWFNPAVWMLKKELQEVHEYQADNKVIDSGADKFDYQMLLLKNLSNGRIPVLVAGIKGRSIKKRLTMMQKKDFKSNIFGRALSVAIAIFCGLILLKMPAMAEIVELKQPISKENVVVLGSDFNDNLIYHIDNKEVSYDEVSKFDSSNIACIEVFNGENKVIGIVTKDYNEANNIRREYSASPKESLPVSKYVKDSSIDLDRMPCYEGGEKQLKKELDSYMRFFSSHNISGIVEISFIVTSEGNLEKFRIIRSLDSAIDIASIRALKSLSGKWIPGMKDGKKIDVEMRIPFEISI